MPSSLRNRLAARPWYTSQARTMPPPDPLPAPREPAQARASSSWTSMLLDLGSTASGLSLAISYEGRRRLKYCITWLQYTIAHTEHHIVVLRAMIAEFREQPRTVVSPVTHQLAQIQHDIANNIRSVINVASSYASDVLPESACKLVRQCILSLPTSCGQKLAMLKARDTNPNTNGSTSPHTRSCVCAEEAATMILTLAVESLDILRKVTHVIGDVVDRADYWAQRLCLVQSRSEKTLSEERETLYARSDSGPPQEGTKFSPIHNDVIDYPPTKRTRSFPTHSSPQKPPASGIRQLYS
ncbi:transcriptional regulator opi1 [Malassezia furfur]|uniref:Transcriptional regulator opi1 n=1 Tax=Malassezia furfur TaxID=55194 RepID=A0ABY8EVG3_MALFU|nr:transcriptional regulator opi1 [Malassezia furfur]